MPVEYSSHARERMEERGITEADVERTLSLPIGNPHPGEPGSLWIQGYAVGGRILKVCVRADNYNYVITAAWLEHGGMSDGT